MRRCMELSSKEQSEKGKCDLIPPPKSYRLSVMAKKILALIVVMMVAMIFYIPMSFAEESEPIPSNEPANEEINDEISEDLEITDEEEIISEQEEPVDSLQSESLSNELKVTATTANYCVKKEGKVIYTPSDSRKKVCQHMYGMSNEPWSISKSVTYQYSKGGKYYTLTAGKYRGVPYTQKNRDYSLTAKVQERMTAAANSGGAVYGVDCSSATAFALRYATGNTGSDNTYCKGASGAYLSSGFLYDGMHSSAGTATTLRGETITYRNNLKKVGNYGNYSEYGNAKTTYTILNNLTKASNYTAGNVYSNVYAKVRPGDALVQYYKDSSGVFHGHVMVVIRCELVYDGGTNINPETSRIYIIDQASPDRSIYKGTGEKSSWRNDETVYPISKTPSNSFTLKNLATKGYFVPVTAFTTSYSIQYNANGGTGAPEAQSKEAYKALSLSSKKPTKTGYTFKCWNTTFNPIAKNYSPGGTYTEDINETLKAKWEANRYNIRYSTNGGNTTPATQTKTYGNRLTLAETIPNKEGYLFKGWSKSSSATSAEYSAGQTITTDLASTSGSTVTLYAVWEKHEHDMMHITDPAGHLKNGSEYDQCTQCKIIKNYATIAGYSTSYVKSFKLSKGKKSFTAKWKKQSKKNQKKFNGYQIRYSLNKDMSNAGSATAKKSSKSKKIKKLDKKKTYYVQLRTYTQKNGVVYYSKWTTKKVKTK